MKRRGTKAISVGRDRGIHNVRSTDLGAGRCAGFGRSSTNPTVYVNGGGKRRAVVALFY